MGLSESQLSVDAPEGPGLGPWHVNLVYIQGRKCVLFVNDQTLTHFIAPDVRRAHTRDLQGLFRDHLDRLLVQEGITGAAREGVTEEYSHLGYAKSDSRSVLGSMKELAFHYEHFIVMEGGIYEAPIPRIIHQLNRMPMTALEYVYPVETLKHHVAAIYGADP